MRGEASRISDRVSRDELAPKLRSTGKDAWRIGNELFTITNVLDHTVQLERALTDPSRPLADEIGLTRQALSSKINGTRSFTKKDYVALADFFDTSVDYLMGRTLDPWPVDNPQPEEAAK